MKYKKIIGLFALVFALSSCGNENKENITEEDKKPVEEEKVNTGVEAGENQGNIDEKTSPNVDEDEIKKDKESVKEDAIKSAIDENIKISPKESFDKIKEEYQDAKIKSISFDKENNGYVYDYEIYSQDKEVEIKIDPLTGDIIKKEEDKEKESKEDEFVDENNLVKIIDNIKIALKDAGDSYKAYEWSLEKDDGKDQIEVSLVDENNKVIEYKVDANDGLILEKE